MACSGRGIIVLGRLHYVVERNLLVNEGVAAQSWALTCKESTSGLTAGRAQSLMLSSCTCLLALMIVRRKRQEGRGKGKE